MSNRNLDICIVLVTFNRCCKLKHALDCYKNQSILPQTIIVVDNNSNDGTREYLDEWKKVEEGYDKIVIKMSSNTGGAGGFYYGMKKALTIGTDWIWVSDDDAFPDNDAFEVLNEFYKSYEGEDLSALCSCVVNNGQVHLGHRNRLDSSYLRVKITPVSLSEYRMKYFECDIYSFVGVLLNRKKLIDAGLPEKDYFIYHDDQEHAMRLRKQGKILVVPKSIVHHDTPNNSDKGLFWGSYYDIRNELLMIRKNYAVRYFVLRYVKKGLRNLTNTGTSKKLVSEALRDAFRNKKGIHDLYKPGWNC